MAANTEIWKDIKGYEEDYQISSHGRVMSIKRGGKILKPRIGPQLYYRICLYDGGKRKYYSIHRLIAEAFIPNPDNKPCIDHIDTDRQNNSISNLRWCTYKENSNNPRTRRNISNGQIGKLVSEKTKRRISKSHINASFHSKEVAKINKDTGDILKTYPSAKEVERAYSGFTSTNVSKACRGGLKTYKGFIWKYI